MWQRSFVGTTVALGEGVDVAIAALGDLDAPATQLAQELRAAERTTRATALARAVRDVVVAIDEGALR